MEVDPMTRARQRRLLVATALLLSIGTLPMGTASAAAPRATIIGFGFTAFSSADVAKKPPPGMVRSGHTLHGCPSGHALHTYLAGFRRNQAFTLSWQRAGQPTMRFTYHYLFPKGRGQFAPPRIHASYAIVPPVVPHGTYTVTITTGPNRQTVGRGRVTVRDTCPPPRAAITVTELDPGTEGDPSCFLALVDDSTAGSHSAAWQLDNPDDTSVQRDVAAATIYRRSGTFVVRLDVTDHQGRSSFAERRLQGDLAAPRAKRCQLL
jgi:hypothetical protein